LKIVGSFSDLLDEEVFLVNLECGEDLVSSELVASDCFPHRAMLEEFPGLEGLEVSFDDIIDNALTKIFVSLRIEPDVLFVELLNFGVLEDAHEEKFGDGEIPEGFGDC